MTPPEVTEELHGGGEDTSQTIIDSMQEWYYFVIARYCMCQEKC
jgi:hypothetical protein